VTVVTPSGQVVPGVANYGLRPTVENGATQPRLEVHLLGEAVATYGDFITVNWLHFLRPESKFSGLEELKAQIAVDRESALEFFRKRDVN
jgi:riboflavin kinase/FMN adenylyltransferase